MGKKKVVEKPRLLNSFLVNENTLLREENEQLKQKEYEDNLIINNLRQLLLIGSNGIDKTTTKDEK